MNIFFITLIIFVAVYIFFNWFAKTSTNKISGLIRLSIIVLSMFLALIMAYAGRYIFSLPFILAILPLIKTKAGIALFQILSQKGELMSMRSRLKRLQIEIDNLRNESIDEEIILTDSEDNEAR